MPRMRDAMRSGEKSSRSSAFSPTPTKRIGTSATAADRERRAAARVAVELGEDDAGERQRLGERLRRRTASCPVIASATNRISSGETAATTARSPSISASSTCRRPAVSTIRTSWPRSRASTDAALGDSHGRFSPGFGVEHRDVDPRPTWTSCSTAAARWRSPATSSGWRPRAASRLASLPAVVVLPEPCRPQSRITAGRPVELELAARPARRAARPARRARS